MWRFENVTSLATGAEALRRRRYGVIEVVGGDLRRIKLRPFPKIVSTPEAVLLGRYLHCRRPGDRILLYYNQPWRFPNFLVLKYAISARDTTMRSLCRALSVLDEIARIKHTDALLCEAANWRISSRLMARWGWKPHCPSPWRRHFIKRFYGDYPPRSPWIAPCFESAPLAK